MLGLDQSAGNSPGMQEMSALLASKMPVAEASEVLERLIGIKAAPATLDREARRQGTRALEERRKLDAEACAPRRPQPAKPYELVVLMGSVRKVYSFLKKGRPLDNRESLIKECKIIPT